MAFKLSISVQWYLSIPYPFPTSDLRQVLFLLFLLMSCLHSSAYFAGFFSWGFGSFCFAKFQQVYSRRNFIFGADGV